MLIRAMFFALIVAAPASPPTVSLQAQVQEASLLADGMKVAVGEFVSNHNRLPASNEEAGLPAPTLIHGRYAASGAVSGSRISFEFGPGADRSLAGKHLYFEGILKMDKGQFASLMWRCKSDDIPQAACPKSCACTGSSTQD